MFLKVRSPHPLGEESWEGLHRVLDHEYPQLGAVMAFGSKPTRSAEIFVSTEAPDAAFAVAKVVEIVSECLHTAELLDSYVARQEPEEIAEELISA